MKYQLFLVGLVAGYEKKKYKAIYAFGDSISDNGNLYELMGHRTPSERMYYHGRFSNGPVWVEYVADSLNATLMNMAYGGATTDNEKFLAPLIPPKYYVPGCLQQVKQFSENYAKRGPDTPSPEESLVSLVFLGNDFFRKDATAQTYSENMEICLEELVSTTGLTNFVFADSNAPELTPAYKMMQKKVKEIIDRSAEAPALFRNVVVKMKAKYPKLNMLQVDIGGLARSVANGTLPYSKSGNVIYGKSCVNPPFDIGLIKPEFCSNPEEYMFWDAIHPTTALHKKLADHVVKALS